MDALQKAAFYLPASVDSANANRLFARSYRILTSVFDLKGRRILPLLLPFIIKPRGRDILVPEPFLHVSDISSVFERIGGRSRPQDMRSDLGSGEPHLLGPVFDDIGVDGFWGEAVSGVWLLDAPKESPFGFDRVTGCFQICTN